MARYEIDFVVKLAYEIDADNPQEAYDKMQKENMTLAELVENSDVFDENIEGIWQKIEENGVIVDEKEVSSLVNM